MEFARDFALGLTVVVLCALINRVRGGGFDGGELPGRAIYWMPFALGAVAFLLVPPIFAVCLALGYFIWGAPAWGHVLARLGDYAPNRPPAKLEKLLMRLPGKFLPAFARMLFVTPAVVAVAVLAGQPWLVLMAPIFAYSATETYRVLFRPLGFYDWTRAELITGALWGVMIVVLALALGGCARPSHDNFDWGHRAVKCTQTGVCGG